MPSLMSRKIALLLVALVGSFVLAGCESSDDTNRGTTTRRSPTTGGTEPRPEPSRMGGPTLSGDGQMSTAVLYVPTGDRATSAMMLEKMVPAEVRVGQSYESVIKVTNISRNPLEGVKVTDTVTGSFSMEMSDPEAMTGDGGSMVWNLGSMGPGESKTVRMTGSASGVGRITNCAEVSYNSQACVDTVVTEPSLDLVKSAPAECLACDDVTLRFRVSNNGTGAARNVMITDQLPSGWKAADGSGVINIPVGTLAAGQSREFESIVKPGDRGTASNTATARADGDLTATSNTTTTVVRLPALAITKSAPDRRFIGRNIAYEITVRNTGDGEARDCMLEDMLPAGTTFVSASDGGRSDGGRVTWNLGTLAPDATRMVTLTIKPGAGGMVRNTATVKAYCAAAATGTAETSVEGIPAVLLEVVDIEDPIEVGSNETYVITVTNQGSAPDTDIRIAFMLEDTMEFVSGTGASAIEGVAAAGTRNFEFAPLPSLAPGADAVWRVVVKGVAPGDARFTVTMNTDQLGRNVQETEATNFYK